MSDSGNLATVPAAASGITTPLTDPLEPGRAVEVAPGVLWMRLPLPMALDHVNVYALEDDDGWTIVDTGLDTRKARAIWESLLSGPLSGRSVARVLITHYHPDHVGLAGWFQSRGAELLTTRTTWLLARMLTLDVQERPVAQTLTFWRQAGMDCDTYEKRANERPFNFADVVSPLPLGYRRIVEGSRLRLAGRDWVVRCGDGHAPEHATLWSEGDNLVIGGDQLLASISPNLGVYATEPDADPVGEWIASTRSFQPYARDEQLVLPGHKLPFTGLPFRLRQMIENHHEALNRLTDQLAVPRTAVECFPALFRRAIGEGEYGLALVEAVAHLNHLLKAGRVSRTPRDDGAYVWQRTQ